MNATEAAAAGIDPAILGPIAQAFFVDQDPETFRQLLLAHPKYLRDPRDGAEWWMWMAARRDWISLMEVLLELGIGIDEPRFLPVSSKQGPDTALAHACSIGELPTIRWLFERGASPNFMVNGKPYSRAMVLAAGRGRVEIVQLLVELGAATNLIVEGKPLADYILEQFENHKMVEYLRSLEGT